jgi:hypothetical protein
MRQSHVRPPQFVHHLFRGVTLPAHRQGPPEGRPEYETPTGLGSGGRSAADGERPEAPGVRFEGT